MADNSRLFRFQSRCLRVFIYGNDEFVETPHEALAVLRLIGNNELSDVGC